MPVVDGGRRGRAAGRQMTRVGGGPTTMAPAGAGPTTSDGSDLVSGVGFYVFLSAEAYSARGKTEAASSDVQIHGATATLNS